MRGGKEFVNSLFSSWWSFVVNFADSGRQQVAKSLNQCGQTSCLHGLWSGFSHNHADPQCDDLESEYLTSFAGHRGQTGHRTFPLHIHEYTQQGADPCALSFGQ